MPSVFKRKIIKFSNMSKPTIKVGLFFVFLVLALKILLPTYSFIAQNKLSWNFFASLFLNKEPSLLNYQGRTNLVILGVAGGENEGADLTDAIIFLSEDYNKKDVVEISLPRDIWSSTLKDKINTAYHYGEEKKKGGGLVLAKAIIEEVVGQPIHYALLLDFSGFEKIIDLVGGVDIFVENSFTDQKYPIEGRQDDFCGGDPNFACRFETLKFDRGLTHMDGKTALKFVRSRQADGEEGTDFARGKRQQLVISALKTKFLRADFFWQNIRNMRQLFSAFDDSLDTDMTLSEQILFLKAFLGFPEESIRKIVLDDGDKLKGTEGFLLNPPVWQYNNTWVLIPRSGEGDYGEIHQYVLCNLENPNCSIKP